MEKWVRVEDVIVDTAVEAVVDTKEIVVEDVKMVEMDTVEVRCGSHPESSSSLLLQRKSSILHIWSFRFLDFCNLTPTFFLICL